MGIMVNLEVDFNQVTDELWRDTFKAVLKLVEGYPFGMLWYKDVMGKRVLWYQRTKAIEDDRIEGAKYIKIDCDLNTKIGAETFYSYSERACYESEFKNDEHYSYVWNSKTQGRQYHRYLIAIGLLIESRLKGSAKLSGDISSKDIEFAKEYIYHTTKEVVEGPKGWSDKWEKNKMSQELFLSMFGTNNSDESKIVSNEKIIIDTIYELTQYKSGMYISEHIEQYIKKLILISKDWKIKNDIDIENMSVGKLKYYILNESSRYDYIWGEDVIEYIKSTKDKYILTKLALLMSINVWEGKEFDASKIEIWSENQVRRFDEVSKVIKSFALNLDLIFWLRENKRFLEFEGYKEIDVSHMSVDEKIDHYKEELAILRLDKGRHVVDNDYALERQIRLLDELKIQRKYKEIEDKKIRDSVINRLYRKGRTKEELIKFYNITVEEFEEVLEKDI